MKSVRCLSPMTACLAALALACGFTSTQLQGAAQPGIEQGSAKVLSVSGQANYTEAGAGQQALKVGMILKAGTTIQTGRGSSVILDLGDNGERLQVKPESTLSLDKLTINRTGADTVVDTQMEIKQGSIVGNVKKLSAASNYQVKTAKGVAGIRGTSFHIYAVGIYRCATGQIIVTIAEIPQPGQPVAPPIRFTVTPGTQVDLSAGAPSGAVVLPLPPGILRVLLNDLTDMNTPGRLIGGGILVTAEPLDTQAILNATSGIPTTETK